MPAATAAAAPMPQKHDIPYDRICGARHPSLPRPGIASPMGSKTEESWSATLRAPSATAGPPNAPSQGRQQQPRWVSAMPSGKEAASYGRGHRANCGLGALLEVAMAVGRTERPPVRHTPSANTTPAWVALKHRRADGPKL